MRTIYTLLGLVLLGVLLAGGSRTAAEAEQRVYLPVMITPPQRIAVDRPHTPSGSPNTTLWQIASVRADGSDPRILAGSDSFEDYSPAWSPRGDRIAFVSTREITPQLYLMRPDGNGQTRLTSLREGVERLRWSPDGSRIAFTDDSRGWLWLINADGSNLIGLESTYVPAFTWAPDSKALAYSIVGPQNPDTQLYGGQINMVRVSNAPFYTAVYSGTKLVLHMDWSPDGSEIAFGCAEGLCAIAPEGTGLRTITSLIPEGLDWSPNSTRLAVSNNALYLIDRDGSNQQKLFTPFSDEVRLLNPQWSPDGSRVGVNLYKSPTTGNRVPFNELQVVDLDGGSISLGEAGGYSWSR